jgi:hypothetical protein
MVLLCYLLPEINLKTEKVGSLKQDMFISGNRHDFTRYHWAWFVVPVHHGIVKFALSLLGRMVGFRIIVTENLTLNGPNRLAGIYR